MRNTIRYFLIFIISCVSIISKAENQEAHVHGLAILTLALENDTLEIQFESPAANIVGFEHTAHSTEEKQAVSTAEAALKSPQLLFSFSGADCSPKETTVDVSNVTEDKHKHHHHKEDHSESNHSEIKANYRFSCQDAQNINSVSIDFFNQFPSIEKINVMWITGNGQGSALLTENEHSVSLR